MGTEEQAIHEQLDEVVNLLAKFVIPIFSEERHRPPILRGSGFFVKVDDVHVLVSAAHVLDMLTERDLFYYVEPNKTKKLEGQLAKTSPLHPGEEDTYDVAVLRTAGEPLPHHPEVDRFACDVSRLQPKSLARTGKYYAVVGYPETRARLKPEMKIPVAALGYHEFSIETNRYSDLGVSADTHVILPLDLRKGFDSAGKQLNIPKLVGMSGSPVSVLFSESSDDATENLSIVAVFTRYKQPERMLISTDVAAVLELIKDVV